MLAIINPGDEVIITEPTYICCVPDIEMCGGKAVVISLSGKDEFKLKPDILERYITTKTKAVFLSSPNNPTCAIMSEEDIRCIVPTIEKMIYLLLAMKSILNSLISVNIFQ